MARSSTRCPDPSDASALLTCRVSTCHLKEICLKAGISEPTHCVWKSKCGGMEASDLKRTHELEAELSKLNRMCAEVLISN